MKPLNLAQTAVGLVLAWGCTLGQAQSGLASVTRIQIQAQSDAPDLQCGLPRSKPRPQRSAEPDPLEWPIQPEVDLQVQDFLTASSYKSEPNSNEGPAAAPLWSRAGASVLRVGIWSDSHLAAGFFTQE
jgi:hypothetical protein